MILVLLELVLLELVLLIRVLLVLGLLASILVTPWVVLGKNDYFFFPGETGFANDKIAPVDTEGPANEDVG